MNEKSVSPNKIKGDKDNEVRIYNHLCFIGRGNLGVKFIHESKAYGKLETGETRNHKGACS